MDTLAITFPQERAEPSKNGILGKLARIYDPLCLVSPTTLQGKFIYREACELKQAWEASPTRRPCDEMEALGERLA